MWISPKFLCLDSGLPSVWPSKLFPAKVLQNMLWQMLNAVSDLQLSCYFCCIYSFCLCILTSQQGFSHSYCQPTVDLDVHRITFLYFKWQIHFIALFWDFNLYKPLHPILQYFTYQGKVNTESVCLQRRTRVDSNTRSSLKNQNLKSQIRTASNLIQLFSAAFYRLEVRRPFHNHGVGTEKALSHVPTKLASSIYGIIRRASPVMWIPVILIPVLEHSRQMVLQLS